MPKLIILGAAAALAEPDRENTFMVLQGDHGSLLIDCAGSPMQRLGRAGINLDTLNGLILTHHHPDHIYGLPSLLLGLWLNERQGTFHIFAPPRTLRAAQSIMDAVEWRTWPDLFPVEFVEVPLSEDASVLDWPDFYITASPGVHMLPVISLRIQAKVSGKILAYCCDTEPSPTLKAVSHGADILLHESAGAWRGHSGAEQAAVLATESGSGRLVLIHYSAKAGNGSQLLEEAERAFSGPIDLAREWATYEF